jgi:hypothetical protein
LTNLFIYLANYVAPKHVAHRHFCYRSNHICESCERIKGRGTLPLEKFRFARDARNQEDSSRSISCNAAEIYLLLLQKNKNSCLSRRAYYPALFDQFDRDDRAHNFQLDTALSSSRDDDGLLVTWLLA